MVDKKSGVWIDEGPNGTGSFQSSDICLSRKDSWNHVPWVGYGVYNESGDRLPYDANGDNNPNTGIAVPYDLQAINGIIYFKCHFCGRCCYFLAAAE